jgi:hypothetical protein
MGFLGLDIAVSGPVSGNSGSPDTPDINPGHGVRMQPLRESNTSRRNETMKEGLSEARRRTRENDDELSDAVCNAVMSQGATDEEIAAVLRHPLRWSYVVRDPNGRAACWGRGKTRAECEHVAEENAAAYAFEMTGGSLQPGWRFLIWPPAAL